jgi:WD40 repeat protein
MSHIFISYSRMDLIVAERIINSLENDDLEPWIDWRSIPKGEEFEYTIQQGIEEADVFLFLVSPDSAQSEWCFKEIDHAVRNGKRILPIVIRDVDLKIIHPKISKRNWIFCRDGLDDFNKAIEETHKTIRTDYEWVKYHTKLQIKALDWERHKDTSRLLRGKELREAEKKIAEINSQEDPQPTKLQREYILASQRNEVHVRQQITIGLVAGFAIMVILSFVAWGQRNEAKSQQAIAEANANIALSRQLAAQAQLLLAGGNSNQMTALLLAIESMRLYPTGETAQILQNNILSHPTAGMKHNEVIDSVAFTPDGKYVISGDRNGVIHVWDVLTGMAVSDSTERNMIVSTVIENDAILSATDFDAWRDAVGMENPDSTYDGSANSAALSHDGKYVVSGDLDGNVRVWDAETGAEISNMSHDSYVNIVVFSPDGNYVASGSRDGTARVWDAATGNEISQMGHGIDVVAVTFSPDGKYVASGGCDQLDFRQPCTGGSARVWEVATGKEVARMLYHYQVSALAFSPDGKYLASGSYDMVARVWKVNTGSEIASMVHESDVNVVAFSPDGNYVASGGMDNTARVWEVATGKEISRMIHNDAVTSVAFSPNGKYVISGSYDGIAYVWETSTGKKISHATNLYFLESVSFSPDGVNVVAESAGLVRVWNALTGKEVANQKGDPHRSFWVTKGDVYTPNDKGVAFSPDGRYVLSGGGDNAARLWELKTGTEIAQVSYESPVNSYAHSWVSSVALDATGQYMAVGGCDEVDQKDYLCIQGSIRVWDVSAGNEVARITLNADPYTVVFSPDGKYVASGGCNQIISNNFICSQGVARVWDIKAGKEIASMIHDGNVDAMAFSPDGRYVASGSWDNTARVWNAMTGEELARMTHNSYVVSLAFSPDGQSVVSGSYDGTARVWKWQPGDLIAEACSRVIRNLSPSEWTQFFGDKLPYHDTCPNLPTPPE